MKVLSKTRTSREDSLNFIKGCKVVYGKVYYRYWLMLSGYKYEIEITKEEADHIRTALEENIVSLLDPNR